MKPSSPIIFCLFFLCLGLFPMNGIANVVYYNKVVENPPPVERLKKQKKKKKEKNKNKKTKVNRLSI